METEELKKADNWWNTQITDKLRKQLTIDYVPSKKIYSLSNAFILKIYKEFMFEDLQKHSEMGICDKCGAVQFLNYNICNYNGICKGNVIPIVYRICDYCTSFKTDENCKTCFSYLNWKAQNNIVELIIADSKKILKSNNLILRKICHIKGKLIKPEWYIEKCEKNHNTIVIQGPIYDETKAQILFNELFNKKLN